jgi:DNA-binding LacI/PurR family transcriptional regulator
LAFTRPAQPIPTSYVDIEQRIDGLFMANDLMAAGALQA